MAISSAAKKTTLKPASAAAPKKAVVRKPAVKAAPKKPVVKAAPAAAKTARKLVPAKVVAKPKKALPAKPTASKANAASQEKAKKPKLVRDSFSMPEPEYAVLGAVKKACLTAGVAIKKSELLRIGVAMIRKMDVAGVKAALATLPPLKAGRPKKSK